MSAAAPADSNCRALAGPGDEGKAALDLGTVGLLPGRKLELPSQLGRILVQSETGRHSRDLEEHPARLTEVDRLEVLPVENLRYRVAPGDQVLAQGALLVCRGNGHGDVMHRAQAIPGSGRAGAECQLEPASRQIAVDREPDGVIALGDYFESKDLGCECDGRVRAVECQCYAVKTADRRAGRDAASGPRRPRIVAVLEQPNLEPGGIGGDDPAPASLGGDIPQQRSWLLQPS